MTVIPHQWRAYLARQVELDQRRDTNSTTWGLEAGLNHLLEQPAALANAACVIAAGARRSRYAQALLAKFVTFDSYRFDGISAMEARSSLTKIAEALPAATINMLVHVACGENPDDIAASLGISVPTFQTRLSRARAAARKLAA